jgi:hypothetical protein
VLIRLYLDSDLMKRAEDEGEKVQVLVISQ